MSKKQKILIIVFSIIIIACIILTVVLVKKGDKSETNNTEEDSFLVTNKELLKEATVEGLKISDISIMKGEEISTYTATVTNEKDEAIHIDNLFVIFTIDDTDYATKGLQDIDLEAKATQNIEIGIDQNLSKASKITYELNKEEE